MKPSLLLASEAAQSTVGTAAEELVSRLLLQIALILVVSRVISYLSRRFLGQTEVAGEILAGLVLGPSLLGAVAPGVMKTIFHASTTPIFVGLAQIGLILLMLQIGMEFEFGAQLAQAKRAILAISLSGMIVPFLGGYFTAPWFWARMAEPRPPELGFRLFFAVAMSITAIPILGRIFMELGVSHTRTAALTIGAAAIDDIAGWLMLGIVSAIVTSRFEAGLLTLRIGALVVYLGFVLVVVRRRLSLAVTRSIEKEGRLGNGAIVGILILLFSSALITSFLGVFALIGGFILGVALHDNRRFVAEWKDRVAPMVNTFFLPLFFAYTGLRTDIGTLGSAAAWAECALVCGVAFVGKFGGAYVAARLIGEDRRASLTIGVCMNTRALMELVVLNVGLDLGVLPRRMFAMLVIMAITSTYMASPLIRRLMASESKSAVPAPVA